MRPTSAPVLALFLAAACSPAEPGAGDPDAGPPAVEEAPDYASAFPQDRVPRLDIVIPADNWQAMLDDMTDMLGPFGEGGGPGGPGQPPPVPPDTLFEACVSAAEGDPCSAQLDGMPINGTCDRWQDGRLFCRPAGAPPPGGGGGGTLVPRTPLWVECQVAYEGRSWQHVGVRFKGNSSLANTWEAGIWKLPLRLRFDKLEDQYPETALQRFHGFQSLSLFNGHHDPSLLRAKVTNDLLAAAGVPAPASAFYRVFIDHGDGPQYFGLYTAVELPEDGAFLETRFGGDDGNLYQPEGAGARWDVYDETALVKESNEEAADWSDARGLYDALHADRADAAAWRAGLEARLDVDGFLRWVAANTVLQNWDAYGVAPHNYFLYADPGAGGRFVWIPWDQSEALGANRAPSLALGEIGTQWPLIRFLLDDPTYAARYREHVATALAPEAAQAQLVAAHELVAPYVVGPEGEVAGYTNLASTAEFEASIDELVTHIDSRGAAVDAFLAP